MKKTHGLSHKHPLYPTWKSMRTRCNNPNSTSYPLYGARGVRICERWDNFELFLEDVGTKPSSSHQLDRINSAGNYEPSNIRWATREQQNVNQRVSGSSGIKGIYFMKGLNKYAARTCKYHGRKHLGVYKTKKEASGILIAIGCTYNEEVPS